MRIFRNRSKARNGLRDRGEAQKGNETAGSEPPLLGPGSGTADDERLTPEPSDVHGAQEAFRAPRPGAIARDLRGLLRDSQVVEAPGELRVFAYDASFETQLNPRPPEAAVIAGSEEDVRALMRYAYERGIPVTPRGAASGQAAGSVALEGGIVLSLNAMNRVLEIDVPNLQAFCEPGVVHAQLNAALEPHRLLFPPDPGSSKMATVGGVASTNANGMRALKYGPTGAWVLGLNVVLPNGQLIQTGSVGPRDRDGALRRTGERGPRRAGDLRHRRQPLGDRDPRRALHPGDQPLQARDGPAAGRGYAPLRGGRQPARGALGRREGGRGRPTPGAGGRVVGRAGQDRGAVGGALPRGRRDRGSASRLQPRLLRRGHLRAGRACPRDATRHPGHQRQVPYTHRHLRPHRRRQPPPRSSHKRTRPR